MRRRVIVFDELKNGTFVCRDGRNGPEFGRSDSFDEAITLTAEWLCGHGFQGEVSVLVKPWRAAPFAGPMIQPNEGDDLWKT